jgi:hypothetical protein
MGEVGVVPQFLLPNQTSPKHRPLLYFSYFTILPHPWKRNPFFFGRRLHDEIVGFFLRCLVERWLFLCLSDASLDSALALSCF